MENMFTQSIEDALKKINNHKCWDGTGMIEWHGLEELLQDGINWSHIEYSSIIPKLKLRAFCKAIEDKEVRLDVMKFLHEYTRYYFYDGAEILAESELYRKQGMANDLAIRDRAEVFITDFQSELATQISQIEKTGQFSGDKFKKQEKRIAELEKQVDELKSENLKFKERINRFEHPEKYGKFIPPELNNAQFGKIMQYLQSKRIVFPIFVEGTYGHVIQCYRWQGSKALFGYYVEQLNVEFELNEAREQRNWQIFEPVFENYDEIVEEARKAVSKYRNNTKNLLPAGADHIKNAIEEANKNDDSLK